MGELTRKMCAELVDEWVTVTDEEICRAILFLLEGEKTGGWLGVCVLLRLDDSVHGRTYWRVGR